MNEEDVEVCPYCGNDRDNKFQCCGENHWVKRSELLEQTFTITEDE